MEENMVKPENVMEELVKFVPLVILIENNQLEQIKHNEKY